MMIWFMIVCLLPLASAGSVEYNVTVTDNGPVAYGENITFSATLSTENGNQPEGTFIYVWFDDAIPTHRQKVTSSNAQCNWTVSYPPHRYNKSTYYVVVLVYVGSTTEDALIASVTKAFNIKGTELNNANGVAASWYIFVIFSFLICQWA